MKINNKYFTVLINQPGMMDYNWKDMPKVKNLNFLVFLLPNVIIFLPKMVQVNKYTHFNLKLVCAPENVINEKLKSGYAALLLTDRLIN